MPIRARAAKNVTSLILPLFCKATLLLLNMDAIIRQKEQGNSLFKSKHFAAAACHYSEAIASVIGHLEAVSDSEEVNSEVQKAYCSLLSNRAVCHLHLCTYDRCKSDCEMAEQKLVVLLSRLDNCDEAQVCAKLLKKVRARTTKADELQEQQQLKVDECTSACMEADDRAVAGDLAGALQHYTVAIDSHPGSPQVDSAKLVRSLASLYLDRGN